MRCFILLLFVLIGQSNTAQTVIWGQVKAKGKPVQGVTIYIQEISMGTTTDASGQYSLALPRGTHKLIIRALGHQQIIKQIEIQDHKNLNLNFSLKQDITGLDQVVISGSRTGQIRHTAPVIVSVISEEDFNNTQSISLSEGLNFTPGLRMETNCQNCGFTQIRMNGLDGAYSQILIDSRPVFSALNGVYGLEQIPANFIERIEVVRGGGSALYGSNAIAGTINIITKAPSEDLFEIATNFASLNGLSLDKALTYNAAVLTEDKKAGFITYAMSRNREGYDHNGDTFTEITEIQNFSIGLKTFYKPTNKSKIRLNYHNIQEFRRGGNKLQLLPHESDITEQIISKVLGGGISYEQNSKNLSKYFSAYAHIQFSRNKNYYGGKGATLEESLMGYGNSLDNTVTLGSQYTIKQQKFIIGRAKLTIGTEFKNNLMVDNKPGYQAHINQNLNILGIYAQQEWRPLQKLTILGGLRADIHNIADESPIFNPRLNILYSLNRNLQFRSSYAKGFRAPQVFTEDIHARIAAGEVALVKIPADLRPETSHSYLVSTEWSRTTSEESYRITLEAFYTRLKNPFILERVSGNTFEKGNGKGARVYGFNLDAIIAPHMDWMLQLGATLQESKHDQPIIFSQLSEIGQNNTREFFRSPAIYGNFILTYAPVKRWQTNFSGVYTGTMYVPHLAGFVDQDKLEETPSFMELNFKTSYKFPIGQSVDLELNIGIQNLLNQYQQDLDRGVQRDANYVYGPSRPRTFFFGLKLGNGLLL